MVGSGLPPVEMTVVNRFTPGLYIREIHVPAGTLFTSMKHRTTHPFVMTRGKIQVISENEGRVTYEAPLTGITEAGTHRAVYVLEDVVWTTFHVTEETDIERIAAEILEPHENPLIPSGHPALNAWRGAKVETEVLP